MRIITALTSITYLFLTCGCATLPANHYRHYDGARISAADESTLYFTNLVDITVDHINLRHMELIEKHMDPRPIMSKDTSSQSATLNGIIHLKPGVHDAGIRYFVGDRYQTKV